MGSSIKILAIGNSFSDDAMEYLYQVGKNATSTEIILGNLYIGGCSLKTHAENSLTNEKVYEYRKNTDGNWNTIEASLLEGITNEQWDIITLQQASGYSGDIDTYNSDLDNLITYVNKTNPNAKLYWHMTWAYASNSTHEHFYKYNCNQATMYAAIVNAVKQKICTNKAFSGIIPVGTAIQNVRSSFIGDTLNRDGFHLSLTIGRYVAALTWQKVLMGWECTSFVPNAGEFTSEHLNVINEAVDSAIKNN